MAEYAVLGRVGRRSRTAGPALVETRLKQRLPAAPQTGPVLPDETRRARVLAAPGVESDLHPTRPVLRTLVETDEVGAQLREEPTGGLPVLQTDISEQKLARGAPRHALAGLRPQPRTLANADPGLPGSDFRDCF